MRRTVITWSVVFAILLAGFGASIGALNAGIYSAHGFVVSYLEALGRHDVDGALSLAGVRGEAEGSDELLTRDALGKLSDIRVTSDEADSEGIHTVAVTYRAGGEKGQSQFRVQRNGTGLGVFTAWRFETSPLATVSLTVLHDQRATVNDLELTSAAAANEPAPYLVFTPGLYVFGHESRFLAAEPVPTLITEPGGSTVVAVDVQASDKFVTQVQKELDKYLDDCATQKVLQPTGCPFGQQISNRVTTTPAWSITSYPPVTIVPGTEPGSWLMPTTEGAAHLVVDVQSLFDGTVSTFDEDVPFTVRYVVTIQADGSLLISATPE